ALIDAGLLDDQKVDRTRFGVYLGSGEGVQDFHNMVWHVAQAYRPDRREIDYPAFSRGTLKVFHAGREIEQELHTTAAHLAAHYGRQGRPFNALPPCAASSQAIGEAADLIRCGEADLMLAGGAHSMIHPFGVTGFTLLTALSTRNHEPQRASRPFDFHRDGFILGEGAGMVVLEELEHAKARGAAIHGEIVGYGSSADAFRITDSHDQGRG